MQSNKLTVAVGLHKAAANALKAAHDYAKKAAFIDATRRNGALSMVCANKAEEMYAAAMSGPVKAWTDFCNEAGLTTEEIVEVMSA